MKPQPTPHTNETAPIGAEAPKARPSFLADDVARPTPERKALHMLITVSILVLLCTRSDP